MGRVKIMMSLDSISPAMLISILIEVIIICMVVIVSLGVLIWVEKKKKRSDNDVRHVEHSGYLAALNVELDKTRTMKRKYIIGQDDNQADYFDARVSILSLEKTIMENSAGDEDKYWLEVSRLYGEYLLYVGGDTANLQRQVDRLKLRLDSMEKFKSLFFDLREHFQSIQAVNDVMTRELARVSTEHSEFDELMILLEKTREEKLLLVEKLDALENVLTEIADFGDDARFESSDAVNSKSGADLGASAGRISSGVDQVRKILDTQSNEIMRLIQVNNQLEDKATKGMLLENILREMDGRNKEMSSIIQILEDENEYLNAQLTAAVSRGDVVDNLGLETVTLRAELDVSRHEVDDLEEKYAMLEVKYLEVYEQLKETGSR